MTDDFTIDLDQERSRRAAMREGKQGDAPIILGGKTIGILPVELPIDVFEPLRNLDEEISILLHSVLASAQGDTKTQGDLLNDLVGLLVANPKLPATLIDSMQQMVKRLIGEDGYALLVEARLRREDLGFLGRKVLDFYGVNLGESKPPSDSSGGGGTTSSTTSLESAGASTPETSTETPATPSTSESVGS